MQPTSGTLTASGNVTNTGTATLRTGKLAGNTGNITLQAIITKVSGTVGGSVKPQGSLDGTNYFDIVGYTAQVPTDVATQSVGFILRNAKCTYYQLLYTGTGTMVATPSGLWVQDDE